VYDWKEPKKHIPNIYDYIMVIYVLFLFLIGFMGKNKNKKEIQKKTHANQ